MKKEVRTYLRDGVALETFAIFKGTIFKGVFSMRRPLRSSSGSAGHETNSQWLESVAVCKKKVHTILKSFLPSPSIRSSQETFR